MICDFCRELLSHKPYVINREILATSTSNKKRVKITFNFCSRTCMIAEEIMAVTSMKMRTLHGLLPDNKFCNEVENEVMRISGCTAEEYAKALETHNTVVEINVIIDNDYGKISLKFP